MARRKFNRRRRNFRRKRRMGNPNTTSNQNRQVVRFKYKQIYSALLNANSVLLGSFQYNSFTNFYLASNTSGPQNLTEPLTHQVKQFDSYKVTYVEIKYTPYHNNSTNLSPTEVLGSVNPIYVCIDVDNSGQVTSAAQIVGRDTAKVYNPYKPFTYRQRIPNTNMSSNTGVKWFKNLQREPNNTAGTIFFGQLRAQRDPAGNPMPQNTPVGEFLVTVWCSFKGRQYNPLADPGHSLYDPGAPIPTEEPDIPIGPTGPQGPTGPVS